MVPLDSLTVRLAFLQGHICELEMCRREWSGFAEAFPKGECNRIPTTPGNREEYGSSKRRLWNIHPLSHVVYTTNGHVEFTLVES